jgi:UDP-N-acetylmuramate--alanine ligase
MAAILGGRSVSLCDHSHDLMRVIGGSMLRDGMHIHLVGIGGSGLSAIARVLQGMGYTVSGSDRLASPLTEALEAEGVSVSIGHASQNVTGADLLLISSAIPPGNAEVLAARAAGIPVLKRADLLGELMIGRTGIAVAGTHGKTTTSAMLASVLLQARMDPSFIVGGVLANLGTNARAGRGAPFVIEADEYDRMFLGLRPRAAVLTAVEHDHPDCYPTFEEMVDAFRQFVKRLPPDGLLVACWDDAGARHLGREHEASGREVRWYGFDEKATWRAVSCRTAGGCEYVAQRAGEPVGAVSLAIPGRHNILNSLAVVATADWLGVPFECSQEALADFAGVARRFETKGEAGGVVVVDDYAHHPTEIAATLAAARTRYPDRRIWAVFQPHTFSRTRVLIDQFAAAFADADRVLVLDIYAARETDNLGIDASALVSRMDHPQARHVGSRRQAAGYLLEHVRPGDLVLTLGAGDGDQVGEWVLDALREGTHEAGQAPDGEGGNRAGKSEGGTRVGGELARVQRRAGARLGSGLGAQVAKLMAAKLGQADPKEKGPR